jgi:hypothetical protein
MHYDEPFMCILEQASQIWLDFIYVIHPKLQLLIKQSFLYIFFCTHSFLLLLKQSHGMKNRNDGRIHGSC